MFSFSEWFYWPVIFCYVNWCFIEKFLLFCVKRWRTFLVINSGGCDHGGTEVWNIWRAIAKSRVVGSARRFCETKTIITFFRDYDRDAQAPTFIFGVCEFGKKFYRHKTYIGWISHKRCQILALKISQHALALVTYAGHLWCHSHDRKRGINFYSIMVPQN